MRLMKLALRIDYRIEPAPVRQEDFNANENGVIFRITEDGQVKFGGFIDSTSYEMQEKMRPILEELMPQVQKYFQNLLNKEMGK